jgi:hypothetical protein
VATLSSALSPAVARDSGKWAVLALIIFPGPPEPPEEVTLAPWKLNRTLLTNGS